jgi:dienelactone hydrolase
MNIKYKKHRFYDAEHSFNNQDTSRYNEVAAKLALKNTLDYFDTYLN